MRILHHVFTLAVLTVAVVPAIASAGTCYRLPFSNPNLADGFGSTKGRAHPHRGVDFPQPRGKSIPAAAAGSVSVVIKTPCLGNVVVLKHADGKYSGYCHMDAKSPLHVGQHIAIGQTVGKVGSTGSCALGAHLHLTMSPERGGYAAGTVIDPYKWIKAHPCSSAREIDDQGSLRPDAFDSEAAFEAAESESDPDDELEQREMQQLIAEAEANADDGPDDEHEPVALELTADAGSDSTSTDVLETDDTDTVAVTGGCAISGGSSNVLGATTLSLLALLLARRRR